MPNTTQRKADGIIAQVSYEVSYVAIRSVIGLCIRENNTPTKTKKVIKVRRSRRDTGGVSVIVLSRRRCYCIHIAAAAAGAAAGACLYMEVARCLHGVTMPTGEPGRIKIRSKQAN